MKLTTRFAILALIPLGCATGENTPNGDNLGLGSGATANDSAGTGGTDSSGTGSVLPQAGTGTGTETGGSGTAGTDLGLAGTFGTAGTFGSAGVSAGGTFGTSGVAGSGGSSGSNAAGAGTAGKAAGGATGTAGTAAGGSAGAGGTGVVVGPYCNSHAKSPLPFTVNDGFQPSGWQGDVTAITSPTVAPNPCDARTAGAVGMCTAWRFTPNATIPAWAGVSWVKMWDANFTHDPVCVADGATKMTFQARGAVGGEIVTFSAAGAAELPFTLTAAWKEYQVSLVGVQYNTAADGVDSGFFWKAGPLTPGGAPVTFFVDDIQFIK